MKAIGCHYEQLAQSFLVQQGLTIITTNYTVYGMGEIDIIAYHDEPRQAGGVCPTLVFVEVKMRQMNPNAYYGQAMEAVTCAKQKKIIKTAEHFLVYGDDFIQKLGLTDVIAFDVSSKSQKDKKSGENQTKTHWLKNAFLVE